MVERTTDTVGRDDLEVARATRAGEAGATGLEADRQIDRVSRLADADEVEIMFLVSPHA